MAKQMALIAGRKSARASCMCLLFQTSFEIFMPRTFIRDRSPFTGETPVPQIHRLLIGIVLSRAPLALREPLHRFPVVPLRATPGDSPSRVRRFT